MGPIHRLLSVALVSALTLVSVSADTPPIPEHPELVDQVFIGTICFEDDWCTFVKTELFLTKDECAEIEQLFQSKIPKMVETHGEVTEGFSICAPNAVIDPKGRKA